MASSILSRRACLAGAAGLAALRGFGSDAPAEFARDDIKLGVASYSLRKFPRARAIEMVRSLRTPYICIKEFHLAYNSTPEELAAARKECESAGLQILSGGVIYLEKQEDLRRMFDYAKGAGMPMMICAPKRPLVGEVEKLVKEYNIRAAIHNHGPEDKEFPTPQSVLEAIRGTDPRMGLCMDIGHTARSGQDVLEWIDKAGKRLFDIHAKDMVDTSRNARNVPVGEGILPVAAMLRLLKKLDYKDGVMLEYEIDEDNPLPGMRESFAYMRGVLAGLRG
jgi:sugar phosphate isomerase/epimerase